VVSGRRSVSASLTRGRLPEHQRHGLFPFVARKTPTARSTPRCCFDAPIARAAKSSTDPWARSPACPRRRSKPCAGRSMARSWSRRMRSSALSARRRKATCGRCGARSNAWGCRIKTASDAPTFEQLTEPTTLQQRAYKLLQVQPVTGTPISALSLNNQTLISFLAGNFGLKRLYPSFEVQQSTSEDRRAKQEISAAGASWPSGRPRKIAE